MKLLDRLLEPPDLKVKSQRSMIDNRTSFFRLTQKVWRLIRDDLRLDIYVEQGKTEIFVDIRSLDHWQNNPYVFPENWLADPAGEIRPLSETEKEEIITKLRWYFFGKYGLPLTLS